MTAKSYITEGSTLYRGFVSDNVYHDAELGDVHFSSYIPESYDGSKPYALFITIPGWDGWLFWGVNANLEFQDFGITAQDYNSEMIVISLQFNACDELTAKQTIAITEYFLENYNIDKNKVYLHGYSAGGETGSIVMGIRPELYCAFLTTSSKWSGDITALVEAETPVYLATAERDSAYGCYSFRDTYKELVEKYTAKGLSEERIAEILTLNLVEQQYFIDRGHKRFDQHGGGMSFAHDEEIMGWLFSH